MAFLPQAQACSTRTATVKFVGHLQGLTASHRFMSSSVPGTGGCAGQLIWIDPLARHAPAADAAVGVDPCSSG
jgi:hypothetical protein